jgi:hypothetical protein
VNHPSHAKRRPPILAAAAATAVAVAAGLGFAGTGSAASSHITRIRVVERVVSSRFVDLGPKGVSPGDRNEVVSDILTPDGRRIGRADLDCSLTGVGPHMGGTCSGGMTLPGGQLSANGAFGPSGSSRLQAITGGTGRFIGARGQFLVSDGTDARTPIVIELLH